jgi:hypothetical protein
MCRPAVRLAKPAIVPKSIYMDRFSIKAYLGSGGFADMCLANDLANKDRTDIAFVGHAITATLRRSTRYAILAPR